MDVETLGQFARIFTSDIHILDLFRLHLPLPDLLARGLAVFEDYDCETVGDPQTAVRSLGELVTFLQVAICRYGVSASSELLVFPLIGSLAVRLPLHSRRAQIELQTPPTIVHRIRAPNAGTKSREDKSVSALA